MFLKIVKVSKGKLGKSLEEKRKTDIKMKPPVCKNDEEKREGKQVDKW